MESAAPRSVIVVPRSKSPAAYRRVAPESISGGDLIETHLPNGDLYIGVFSGEAPHGRGKYLWRDGCMYEGDWRKGKASGRGRFAWPSGATFEGEFRSGRMEGVGTFIGPGGDTYRGLWVGGRRHGYGVKHYASGDWYEGQWRRDTMDGKGRYVWRDGNEYVGEWRNGMIHGKGVMIWSNGNRYEGNWEAGVPKPPGVFSWVNSREDFGRGRRLLAVPVVRQGLNAVPRICVWGGLAELHRELAANNVEETPTDGMMREFKRSPGFVCRKPKKPGQAVTKGHKNYDLMLNLQLGIRYSMGKYSSISSCDLKPSDFDPKERFWTRFPPEGSKVTPPHQSMEFRWKDYCPAVFRQLRELFGVDPSDYMLAICGNNALRELSSPGKSGSLFYLTHDDRFMIKTAKKSEVKVLIKMLQNYYQHVCRYENSLLTKFYGVHCIKPAGGIKTRFIVMGNVFCSAYQIHRRFDLKGSSHGRATDKPEAEIDETTTLKDLDLSFVFRLQTKWYHELSRQIERDCEFLEAERIMDYSLLVGLHFREDSTEDKMGLSSFLLQTGNINSYTSEDYLNCRNFLEAKLLDIDQSFGVRTPLMRLGAGMPARAERVTRDQCTFEGFGNQTSPECAEVYEAILYLGIIDILQDYDISKKLEHAYKSLQVDPSSISAVDPKLYSRRFQEFVRRIFLEDR